MIALCPIIYIFNCMHLSLLILEQEQAPRTQENCVIGDNYVKNNYLKFAIRENAKF